MSPRRRCSSLGWFRRCWLLLWPLLFRWTQQHDEAIEFILQALLRQAIDAVAHGDNCWICLPACGRCCTRVVRSHRLPPCAVVASRIESSIPGRARRALPTFCLDLSHRSLCESPAAPGDPPPAFGLCASHALCWHPSWALVLSG